MSEIQQLHITEQWIREYARSINSPLQFFQGKLIAPSTMPIIFWPFFKETANQDSPVLHGSQKFLYEELMTAGMLLDCELALLKMEEKKGKTRKLTLSTYELTCKCEGRLIVVATTILIQVGETNEKIHHS